jgi:site-specific DNA recombinase
MFEELDESGSRHDRPLLMEAIDRIEAGHSQGIVVAKLDRFGRSLADGLRNIERIQAAGGNFVSVHDGLDLDTPTGKLVFRVMLSMAEFELDRIRESWATARKRAVERGVYPSRTPIGYQRGVDGRLEIDRHAGPIVLELFRRRAAGELISALCRYLDEAGLLTSRGNSNWVGTSVSGILRNRVYLGESRSGEFVNRKAHPALVEAPTWQEAQAPRRQLRPKTKTPLAGLLRCAGCRFVMSHRTARLSGREIRVYRCTGKSSLGACPSKAAVRADEIEPAIEEHFLWLLASRKKLPGASQVQQCQREIGEREAELATYRDNASILMVLGEERFIAGLSKRRRRVDHALQALAGAERARGNPRLGSAGELDAQWHRLTVAERRQILGEMVDCVFVRGQGGKLTERTHVCCRGQLPAQLPARGRQSDGPFGPYIWPTRRARRNRFGPVRTWPEKRIRVELLSFLGQRRDWPGYEEFVSTGHARLWAQVMAYGTPWFWSAQLGLDPPDRFLVPRWNEDRLRAALTAFLRGQETWPLCSEFNGAGLDALRRAIDSHGGVARWASEFGLERRDHRRGGQRYWTEERVHSELRGLVTARSTYPTPTQFREAGHWNLYVTIGKRWGHHYWAERLGLPRQRPWMAGPRSSSR